MPNSDWKVLLTEEIDKAGIELLNGIADVIYMDEYDTKESLYSESDEFDAVLVRTSEIATDFIKSSNNLKVISKHGTGLDNIDISSASEHGVLVCNTPHVNAAAVAEHTIALLLAVRKQLLAADKDIRRGKWNRNSHISHELRGDTLGLYGCGAVGSQVGKVVQALGMKCVAYDPYVDESELSEGIEMASEKENLFKAADLLSIHTPLTHETYHGISTNELSHLPKEGIIVNTSRGEIIDQNALVAALDAGELAGAGLDVFADEPPSPNDPLLEFDTVIASPHIGGSSVEALRQMSVDAAKNIQTVYKDGIPDSTVNADKVGVS